MSSWKAAERQAAKLFGTKRNPLSGMASGITASDSHHPRIFLETKHYARFAAWNLYEKTKALASKEDKFPVLALKQKGKHGTLIATHSNDLGEFCIAYLTAQEDLTQFCISYLEDQGYEFY